MKVEAPSAAYVPRIPRWLPLTCFFVCVANFIAFGIGADAIGGDAINGIERNGHYFVSNKGHLTEVGHAVFIYSTWHSISVMITAVTTIVIGAASKLEEWMSKDDL
jgi:hypothetical protein